jgi:hypothetical protein
MPVLAQLAAAAVGREAEEGGAGERHRFAVVDHRRPPLDRDAAAADEGAEYRDVLVPLRAGVATGVGPDLVVATKRRTERGGSVVRVLGKE